MNNSAINRLALFAMILAGALAVSGVALAGGLRPDDRADVRGIGAARATSSEVARPDDRGGPRGIGATFFASSRTHQQPVISARQVSPLVSVDGFEWADAAVGAGSAVAAIALITAAAAAIKRNHRSAQAKV